MIFLGHYYYNYAVYKLIKMKPKNVTPDTHTEYIYGVNRENLRLSIDYYKVISWNKNSFVKGYVPN